MDDFDLTQPMSLCYEDDEPIAETNDTTILKIPVQNGIPKELEFSLHNGENKIGRSESCEVCIKTKVLSKEHAVIEIGGDCFLIYDLNSSNKTWKGKKPLKPNVKYKLEPCDEVSFGNIKAQFLIKKEGDEAGDSGSETGSESMLLLNEECCAFSVSTPIKNTDVNEVGTNATGSASTSKALFPQNQGTAEEEKTKPPKEAAIDLESAPTQEFNGADFCDSDAETDCEDHSAEKTLTKDKEASHSASVASSCHEKGSLKGKPTSDKTCTTGILDRGGESSKASENLANQAQAADKIINVQCSENSFNKHQKLPQCNSLDESSEELPPTQINWNLLEHHKASESVAKNNEVNNEHRERFLESLDSLPETQVNTRIFDADFEVPESPRHEIDDDLPPTQCISSHVENNISNINVLKHKVAIPEPPEGSESNDDLPPTQLNPALQFSEEQNCLQRDDSQSSCDNNALSPKPSTSSGINSSRSAPPQSSSRHKKSNGSSERKSITSNSSKTLLSCINISVEEGSPSAGGSSILCPSTQRRSDGFDYKIKNTDIHCSPTLRKGSNENVRNSIAETPPHLLKESAVVTDISSTVTSLSGRLSEVSPIAFPNLPSTSSSPSKTSDGRSTPDTNGRLQPKASTPDSAKAGKLNYSGNYSPKVYTKKLNDMDKKTQEILQLEHNEREATTPNIPKNLIKEPEHPKSHTDTSVSAKETKLDPINDNKPDGDDTGRGKRQTNKKRKAARKAGNRAKVTNNSSAMELSPESNTSLKAMKSSTNKADASPNSSSWKHISETHNHEESDYLNNVPQKHRPKRGNDVSAKNVSDISKKLCFEGKDSDKSVKENSAKSHSQKTDDSSASVANTSDLKLNKRLTRKKKPENDQSIQQLPSRQSKRQKYVSSEKSNENGDICGKDISSDVTKEIDSKNDFVSTLARKSVRRKLLPFEPDSNMPGTNQEVGFSVFRKSEALGVENDSLLDTRASKRRKVNPVKDVDKRGSPLVKVQRSKQNLLSLNESEVSVSSSSEHCNVVVQEDESDTVEIAKSGVNTKDNSDGHSYVGPKKGARVSRKHNIRDPCPSISKQKAKDKTNKSEMQHDSSDKTIKNHDQSASIEKSARTEESPLRRKRTRVQRSSVQLRQSRKKEILDTTPADKSLASSAPLDTDSKTESEDSMSNKLKKNSSKTRASRSKQLHKEKVVHHSNINMEDASVLSLESSSRSLRLRLSASETSTDESPGGEKCQISVFAKDSVESLIKLDTQNLSSNQFKNPERRASRKVKLFEEEDTSKKEEDNNVSVQGVRKGRQSRSKYNLKGEEEDDSKKDDNSNVSVQGEKKGRQSRSKHNLKEEGEGDSKTDDNSNVSVQAVRKGRQSQSRYNLKEEEEGDSKKDDNINVSVQGKKKGRQPQSKFNLKEVEGDHSKEEVNSDVSVQVTKTGRQSRSKLNMKDNLSSPPAANNKRRQNLNSSSVSDSTCDNDVTPAKNKKAKTTKDATFTSPSSRSQQCAKPKVMFTLVEDEEPLKVVVSLGGRVVEDVNMCTRLVSEKLRRTVKALCCIGKGVPLVNTKWIQECKKSESFVDHLPYLIKDKAMEKQYQFDLRKTLQNAAEKPLLSSWSVHVTPKVVPSPEQMKDIIQCAGGKYLPKMPNRLSEKTVVITCAADLNLCSHAIKCGLPVVGSEFILTGLLQYKIDTKSYALSKK